MPCTFAPGCAGPNHFERAIDARLRAAVDDDLRARAGEACGDRQSDSGGRAGDESGSAVEVEIHDAARSSSIRGASCGESDGAVALRIVRATPTPT